METAKKAVKRWGFLLLDTAGITLKGLERKAMAANTFAKARAPMLPPSCYVFFLADLPLSRLPHSLGDVASAISLLSLSRVLIPPCPCRARPEHHHPHHQ